MVENSINQEKIISHFSLGIENHFKRYLPKSIIEDDEENEDKTILIEKGSDEKIPLDDNQCNNGIILLEKQFQSREKTFDGFFVF